MGVDRGEGGGDSSRLRWGMMYGRGMTGTWGGRAPRSSVRSIGKRGAGSDARNGERGKRGLLLGGHGVPERGAGPGWCGLSWFAVVLAGSEVVGDAPGSSLGGMAGGGAGRAGVPLMVGMSGGCGLMGFKPGVVADWDTGEGKGLRRAAKRPGALMLRARIALIHVIRTHMRRRSHGYRRKGLQSWGAASFAGFADLGRFME